MAEAKTELEEANKLREQEKLAAEKTAKRLSKSIESLLGELSDSYFAFLIFTDEHVVTVAYFVFNCCRCA